LNYDRELLAIADVQQLTQLTGLRLRMTGLSPGDDSHSTCNTILAMGMEGQGQLQLLEVTCAALLDIGLQDGLRHLHSLNKVVVLMTPADVQSPAIIKQLTSTFGEWHSSSSSAGGSGTRNWWSRNSSSTPSSAAAPSSAAGVGAVTVASSSRARDTSAAVNTMPRVQLTLEGDMGPAGVADPGEFTRAFHQLQQVAAGMVARLPRLEVTCAVDTYSGPCWTGEEGARWFETL
jgi:hypothetical protein